MLTKKRNGLFAALLILILAASPVVSGCKKAPGDKVDIDYNSKIADIVSEGKASGYKIVKAKNASDAQEFAAEELQSFIEQTTGASLPIIDDEGVAFDDNAKLLSVGKTSVLANSGLNPNYAEIRDDGFFIKTKGNSMFIDANLDRGVIYGVYDFLEQIAGVRFIARDCTRVPALTSLPLYKTDRTVSPDFAYRCINATSLSKWGSSLFGGLDEVFSLRMRANGSENGELAQYGGGLSGELYTGINFGHNSLKWVDPEVYLEEHPEMFKVNSSGEAVEVCLTDGITEDGKIDETKEVSAIKVAIESFKEFIADADPAVKYYMFGQQDNLTPCDCADCRAAAAKYRRSGIGIRFANILAEEGRKWAAENAPEKEVNLVQFAYAYSELAPVDDDYKLLDPTCKPNDNVIVYLAPLYADYYFSYGDERQPITVQEVFKSWKAVDCRIFLWSYHNDFKNNFWYLPASVNFAETLKFFKDFGVESLFMQTADNCLQLEDKNMDAYIASHLMWDTSLDVNILRKEFIDNYYGPGAVNVSRYYDDFNAHIKSQIEDKGLRFTALGAAVTGTEHHNARYYPLDFMNAQLTRLDKAKRAVADDAVATEEDKAKYALRIRNLRIVPNYMMLENYSSYYPGLTAAKKYYAQKFFDECDALGILYYKEGGALGSLMEQYA
jgi:hypothetical protein